MTRPWLFDPLERGAYGLIMADPAWSMLMRSPKGTRKSASHHYRTMSLPAIAGLPVDELAAPDCILFLWAIWPLMLYGGDPRIKYRDADASRSPIGRVIDCWGFRYATGGAWVKRTKNGKAFFGPGYRARSSTEPFLICVKGSPDTSRAERNLLEGLHRGHSRKPEDAYAWCERYMPGARRCELFSRSSRPGWDTWGRERTKFDQVSA